MSALDLKKIPVLILHDWKSQILKARIILISCQRGSSKKQISDSIEALKEVIHQMEDRIKGEN